MKKNQLNESDIPVDNVDPYLMERERSKEIKIKINRAKITLPITSALFEDPGMNVNDENLSEAIEIMMGKTRAIVEKVVDHFKLKENGYYFGLIGERATEIVAEAWKNGYKDVDAGNLANILISYIDETPPVPEIAFTDAPRAADEALMWGVVMDRCTATFDVIRPFSQKSREMWLGSMTLEDFISKVRESINSDVARAMETYGCNTFTKDDEMKFRLGFMKTVGRVYASALFSEVNKQLHEIKSMTAEQRAEYHKASVESPSGLLFDAAYKNVQRNLEIVYPELSSELSHTDKPLH